MSHDSVENSLGDFDDSLLNEKCVEVSEGIESIVVDPVFETSLLDLPDEILYRIFSLLPLNDRSKLWLNNRLERIDGMMKNDAKYGIFIWKASPDQENKDDATEPPEDEESSVGLPLSEERKNEERMETVSLVVPAVPNDDFLRRMKKLANFQYEKMFIMRFNFDSDAYRTTVFDLLKKFRVDDIMLSGEPPYTESKFRQLVDSKKAVEVSFFEERLENAPMYYRLIKSMFDESVSLRTFSAWGSESGVLRELVELITADEDIGPHFQVDEWGDNVSAPPLKFGRFRVEVKPGETEDVRCDWVAEGW